MALKRSKAEWVAQYAASHQNPVNSFCHMLGIPMIALALVLMVLALEWPHVFLPALVLFASGWALQFIGHAFESKKPEFLSDWRFLLVGLRWWFAKMKVIIARQI